jgi:GntR family transcriptional regulator, arabinose operon transcriptional repressor
MNDIEKPKYQQLKDYIIEKIKTGQVSIGEKIYSENELAESFNMSRNTVRQSIGELVNEGWLYRVQGKGTFVNRIPGTKNNAPKTIAVVTTCLSNYIFPSLIRGIDSIFSTSGYSMILSCTYDNHEKERICLENLLNQNIAGLIVEPTKSALANPNIDLYKRFTEQGIPILFIQGSYKELDYSYIVEDDMNAAYLAANHLIGLGHRMIGGIFKMDDVQSHYRLSGFQTAHLDAGLQISDSMIYWFETDSTDTKFKSTESNLKKLLSNCTALVCCSNEIALKVMDILRDKDLKIPENISLVSFDDSQLALVSEVKLTTVAHSKENLGEEAAKAMINMINRTKDYYDLKMKPKLIVRSSTQKLKGGI